MEDSRDHRFRIRNLIYTTAALLVLPPLCVYIIWPSLIAFHVRNEIVSAIQRAKSVRLEEYTRWELMTSVELPRDEWRKVTETVPLVPDVGRPYYMILGYVPNHRIVVIGEGNKQFAFRICFYSSQAATEKSGIFTLPYLWRYPLYRLFIEHNVPVRSDMEYASHDRPAKANPTQSTK